MQGFMPPDAFMFDTSGQLMMQTAIGGAGTLFGPLVGASLWLFLSDFCKARCSSAAPGSSYSALCSCCWSCFLRHGIVGGLADLVRLIRRLGPAGAPAPEADTLFEGSEDCTPTPMRQAPVSRGTADIVLETKGVSRRFGGILANSDIDFRVRRGELPRYHRSERRGQDHVLQDAHLRGTSQRRPGSCSKAVISPASMSPRSVSSD